MFQINDILASLYPEFLVLSALIIAILLSNTRFKNNIWFISILFLISASVYIVMYQFNLSEQVQILGGMFVTDRLSILFRFIALVMSALIILSSVKYSDGFIHKSEFFIILLSSVLGIMFLAGANDLITLFVALETLGLSSIMLAGYAKYDTRSNEASIKYLLNSAAASAIFLFGLALTYGISGATQFYEIKFKLIQLFNEGNLNESIILVILTLIITGLAFKLTSVPLHMWSPDVYEGAPTPVTAFLSVASKAAALAISIRILYVLFGFALPLWQPLLVVIAILSMVVGNLVALGEVISKASIKRLMAYSSIAQIGYILIGLTLAHSATISASIFYFIVYAVMNIGAFLCIIAFGNEADSDSISAYSGLIKKRPLLTLAFAACLFNLGGLPIPPAGFIAKFILIKASFEAGSLGIILGSIALVTTIISIYYYSYIAKIMIVDPESSQVQSIDSNKNAIGKSKVLNAAIAISIVGIFTVFLFSHPLLKTTNNTAISLSDDKETYISITKR